MDVLFSFALPIFYIVIGFFCAVGISMLDKEHFDSNWAFLVWAIWPLFTPYLVIRTVLLFPYLVEVIIRHLLRINLYE